MRERVVIPDPAALGSGGSAWDGMPHRRCARLSSLGGGEGNGVGWRALGVLEPELHARACRVIAKPDPGIRPADSGAACSTIKFVAWLVSVWRRRLNRYDCSRDGLPC